MLLLVIPESFFRGSRFSKMGAGLPLKARGNDELSLLDG